MADDKIHSIIEERKNLEVMANEIKNEIEKVKVIFLTI